MEYITYVLVITESCTPLSICISWQTVSSLQVHLCNNVIDADFHKVLAFPYVNFCFSGTSDRTQKSGT